MEEKLITLAREVAKLSFMNYPDYDEDLEFTLADALTLLVMENVGEEDIESVEVYDFLEQITN